MMAFARMPPPFTSAAVPISHLGLLSRPEYHLHPPASQPVVYARSRPQRCWSEPFAHPAVH